MTVYLHFPDNSALVAELNSDSQKQSPGWCSSSGQMFRAVIAVEDVLQFCYRAYAVMVAFVAR